MSSLVRFAIALSLSGCASSATTPASQPAEHRVAESAATVVGISDVQWSPLNPARGNKGPQAGALWGDRTASEASGFLVKFVDGFSSPPHIHNITYRGVVIRGQVFNDDPDAPKMWMPARSYWTQPTKGDVHITAAQGTDNVAYIEIQEGPYLVRPIDQAFEDDDKPLNLPAPDIVYSDAASVLGGDQASAVEVAALWGDVKDGQPNGVLVRLPVGFDGGLSSKSSTVRAVVIQGQAQHRASGQVDSTLAPGSYLSTTPGQNLPVGCPKGCTLYVRTAGTFRVTTASP